MHDLRHDPDAPETPHDLRSPEARLLEAARRGMVDARLLRLEDSLKRLADAVQIMALERDRGKQ